VELSYDQLIDQLIEMRKEEAERLWDQASVVFVLRNKMQAKAGDLASSIGCSAVYINDLARTFGAFPDPTARNIELTFSHHKLCAKSDSPEYWLNMAEQNQWSTRQLQDAIKGKKKDDPLEKVRKLYEKIEKVLDEGGPEGEWLQEQIRAFFSL